MSKLRYVGLDVHKDTIVMAVAEEGQGEAKVLGAFPHDVAKLIKRLVKLEPDVSRLRVCYEAGPTGFGLCRRLKKAGIDCIVVAPSLVPQQGSRVKTDRRDARRLAHFLRSGDLTAVWVPDEQTEALRDLERSRGDAKNAERVARHQLDKFLLRNELVYHDGRSWTQKHSVWLKQQKFDDPCQQCVMDDYVKAVEDATERVMRDRTLRRADGAGSIGEGTQVISWDQHAQRGGDRRGDRRLAAVPDGSAVHVVRGLGRVGTLVGEDDPTWPADSRGECGALRAEGWGRFGPQPGEHILPP